MSNNGNETCLLYYGAGWPMGTVPKDLREIFKGIGEREDLTSEVKKNKVDYDAWYAECYLPGDMSDFNIGYFTRKGAKKRLEGFRTALGLVDMEGFDESIRRRAELVVCYKESGLDKIKEFKSRFSDSYFSPRKFVRVTKDEVREIFNMSLQTGLFWPMHEMCLNRALAAVGYEGKLLKYKVFWQGDELEDIVKELKEREDLSNEIKKDEAANYGGWYAKCNSSKSIDNISFGYTLRGSSCGSKACVEQENFVGALELRRGAGRVEVSYVEGTAGLLGDFRKELGKKGLRFVRITKNEVLKVFGEGVKKGLLEFLL